MEFENQNMFQEDWNDVQFIKHELLEGNLDPWDKIILVYLAYMGYQNFQLANKSYQIIQKTSVEIPFTQQFMIYFLLFYSLNNIHTSYRYFLFKTFTIHPEVARRIYQKFNKYFDYFGNSAPVSDPLAEEISNIQLARYHNIDRSTHYTNPEPSGNSEHNFDDPNSI